MRQAVKALIGEGNLGRLDFFRFQEMRHSWGGPFNGQKFRQRIFFDLLYHLPIRAIIETGTFRGSTTNLLAATSLPVYTAEISPRFFSYSKLRFLFNRDNLHLYNSDSRSFLRQLGDDATVPKEDVFFYLDAHWGEDLPLREELEIIFSKWKRPIVMVDDFQVPGSGYSYDDYGPGKALTLDYVASMVSALDIAVFFPAAAAADETGSKRGSIILCEQACGEQLEARIKTLVRDRSLKSGR